MPRYAFVYEFLFWEDFLQSAELYEFQGQKYIILDSLTISDEDINFLKNNQPIYCTVCKAEVFLRRKHKRKGRIVHPHWVHKNGSVECFRSESLAHALTKQFIFRKLKEKGYIVKEEQIYQVAGKTFRADVAVIKKEEASKLPKLVVEVQASKITVADCQKRIAAYYQQKIPVAWVILLDNLLEGYQILDSEKDDGKSLKKVTEMKTDKEYTFTVSKKKYPFFTFLLNHYQYIMGIQNNGKVLLIRRSPVSARSHARAHSLGEKWTEDQDQLYVSLIGDDQVADVLLIAPLISMSNSANDERKNEDSFQVEGAFKGKDCLYTSHSNKRKDVFIDFESGKTTGNTLDSLKLIHETWNAAKQGTEDAKREKLNIETEIQKEEYVESDALFSDKNKLKEKQWKEINHILGWEGLKSFLYRWFIKMWKH